MPELEIAIPRPQRWDEPFGEMSDADVDELLRIEPFRSIDPIAFPPTVSLRGVLLGDTRVVRFEAGNLIVREGDYGNSAFLVLAGSVRVVLERINPELLGRDSPPARGWKQAIAQLWQNAKSPEVRRFDADDRNERNGSLPNPGSKSSKHVFLQDVPRLLETSGSVRLGRGEMFGELAALSRTPRTATVFADGNATLLEIRWQGLRDLMRRTPVIKQHVERLYRENSLRVHLRETPLMAGLDAEAIERIAAATVFESYGNFDWYVDFGVHRERELSEQLAMEPLIVAEGDRPTGMYLIRSGFARVSRRHGHAHQTVAYLGKGHVFGLNELTALRDTDDVTWRHSLRAVGYVDVLRIPIDIFRATILPTLIASGHVKCIKGNGDKQSSVEPRLLDFLADHRFLNGTQTMLINLDRCTRCDDCVRACAATHDNNPRFVREGPTHNHLMVANACMHCVDPVCLIGCPTGAIARDAEIGTVRINDRTCVGCATCANSCPYNAIRMVEIREPGGAIVLDDATRQPILKATKCDFCTGQITGPACQHACPHDALARIDMADVDRLANWLER